jgi:hypothetical protein
MNILAPMRLSQSITSQVHALHLSSLGKYQLLPGCSLIVWLIISQLFLLGIVVARAPPPLEEEEGPLSHLLDAEGEDPFNRLSSLLVRRSKTLSLFIIYRDIWLLNCGCCCCICVSMCVSFSSKFCTYIIDGPSDNNLNCASLHSFANLSAANLWK